MDGHTASRRPCFHGIVIGHQPNSYCRILLLLIFPDNVVVQGRVGGWMMVLVFKWSGYFHTSVDVACKNKANQTHAASFSTNISLKREFQKHSMLCCGGQVWPDEKESHKNSQFVVQFRNVEKKQKKILKKKICVSFLSIFFFYRNERVAYVQALSHHSYHSLLLLAAMLWLWLDRLLDCCRMSCLTCLAGWSSVCYDFLVVIHPILGP